MVDNQPLFSAKNSLLLDDESMQKLMAILDQHVSKLCPIMIFHAGITNKRANIEAGSNTSEYSVLSSSST